jgi:hypothetical protein
MASIAVLSNISISPSSLSSSISRTSSSPSLSPAHSITASSNLKSKSKQHHQRRPSRPSPLKRQMSVGNGVASSTLEINPHRDHAAGPLAVLYSVQPDEDPLLCMGAPGSPSKNAHSSPFNDNVAVPSIEAPRPVSALASLEYASPNRSLLSAFQAVSPRSQAIASRSTSAPSLSNLASPRGVLPQNSPLGPASPINTSPRQSPYYKGTYATAAFRALNGASPQKHIPSRTSSSGSASHSDSLPVTANVSPVRSRSSSALRQVQNDAPSKPSIASTMKNPYHRLELIQPSQQHGRYIATLRHLHKLHPPARLS